MTQLGPIDCKQKKSARNFWESLFFSHKGTDDASALPSLLIALNLPVIFGAAAAIL